MRAVTLLILLGLFLNLTLPQQALCEKVAIDSDNLYQFIILNAKYGYACQVTSSGEAYLGCLNKIGLKTGGTFKKTPNALVKAQRKLKTLRKKKKKAVKGSELSKKLAVKIKKQKSRVVDIRAVTNGCQVFAKASSGVSYRRLSKDVYQFGVVLFVDESLTTIQSMLRSIKEEVFGSSSASTAYSGKDGAAQLHVQIEFSANEYSADENASLARLKSVIELAKEEGFAIQLLLGAHYLPQDGWLSKTWSKLRWEEEGEFLPYQPCYERESDGLLCLWDQICENFSHAVIKYLKKEKLFSDLAVVYLFNEPGYTSSTNDNKEDWSNREDWEVYRSKALVQTVERCLDSARELTKGELPIGVKFADVLDAHKGWGEVNGYDPLEEILNDTMGPKGDVVSYSGYWPDQEGVDPYAPEFKERFSPFVDQFRNGRFVIGEYNIYCEGSPGSFTSGRRMTDSDMLAHMQTWDASRSYSLFAYNSSDCYALVNQKTQEYFSGAKDVLQGISAQIKEVTGVKAF